MTRTSTIAAAAVVTALLVGGCASDAPMTTTNISLGQQLIDLKDAHDKGALSDKEYKNARERIIDNAR
jgi:hypothetical protein